MPKIPGWLWLAGLAGVGIVLFRKSDYPPTDGGSGVTPSTTPIVIHEGVVFEQPHEVAKAQVIQQAVAQTNAIQQQTQQVVTSVLADAGAKVKAAQDLIAQQAAAAKKQADIDAGLAKAKAASDAAKAQIDATAAKVQAQIAQAAQAAVANASTQVQQQAQAQVAQVQQQAQAQVAQVQQQAAAVTQAVNQAQAVAVAQMAPPASVTQIILQAQQTVAQKAGTKTVTAAPTALLQKITAASALKAVKLPGLF